MYQSSSSTKMFGTPRHTAYLVAAPYIDGRTPSIRVLAITNLQVYTCARVECDQTHKKSTARVCRATASAREMFWRHICVAQDLGRQRVSLQ